MNLCPWSKWRNFKGYDALAGVHHLMQRQTFAQLHTPPLVCYLFHTGDGHLSGEISHAIRTHTTHTLGWTSRLRTGEKCWASSSSLHSGHQASMFHSKMPTMATRMLPSVMRQPAMIGEAMRHVKSILRMPA